MPEPASNALLVHFAYHALDPSNQLLEGSVDASSELEALAILQERGLTPVRLKAQSGSGQPSASRSSSPPRHSDIVALVRELATLLESGVGLSDAFATLLEATTHPGIRDALSRLDKAVRGGERFSSALASTDLALPQYVHALARAGEATGDLGGALTRSAIQLEFDERMRGEAKEALTYPAILVVSGVAAIAFVFAFVVPRFAGMLKGRSVDLPLLSKWVLATGVYVHDNWILVLTLLSGIALGFFVLSRHPQASRTLTKILSGMPILSSWVAGGETARWTAMLAVLVQSKVPILMCIELAASSVLLPGNSARLKSVSDDVRRGKPLSSAIAEQHLLEGSSLTMLRVGEKSGQLAPMLAHIAEYCANKHRAIQRRLIALIEPISILLIGSALGVIMVGVVLAMTSLTEVKL